MDGLTLRVATEADAPRVARIMHESPGREAVALLGGEQQARRLGFALAYYQGRTRG